MTHSVGLGGAADLDPTDAAMKTQLITLTTDFGEGSPYVAQMKAVILTIHPQATLIDITHSISPQDIRYGALVLDDVAPRFPAATMHVCVVDPGVGTGRKIVYAGIGNQQFVAPDNGLLSLVAAPVSHERRDCRRVAALLA